MSDCFKVFREYLQYQKAYSSHTVIAYCDDLSDFKQFNKRVFEQESIDLVNYRQIRSWIGFLSENNLTATSINRKIASLKAYYKFLMRIRQIEANPLIKHRPLKVVRKIQIPFSENELDAVLKSLEFKPGFDGVRDKLVIELFYATGMRRAELIGLQLGDVDFSSNTIKILGKRNKERIVPVLPVVMDQMREYERQRNHLQDIIDKGYFLLLKNGVKLNDSFVYRLINCYFSNVSEKVKKSPHMLRHTFATHMLNNGADLNSVKELLGHSSLASTQVYTHSSLAELKKVYGKAHPRSK